MKKQILAIMLAFLTITTSYVSCEPQILQLPWGEVESSHIIQPDGKTLVLSLGREGTNWTISRFNVDDTNPDGTLDESFGNNGRMGQAIGMDSPINSAFFELQNDGKILVDYVTVRDAERGETHRFRARINPDGTFDTTFGQDGSGIEEVTSEKLP